MWQPTTSHLVVTFSVQNQLILMETAAGDVKGQTTINKKNEYHGYYIYESIDVLIAMIWQRMDSTIHMYLEKMRYPEILKNYLNQFNDSFLDHRTNLI